MGGEDAYNSSYESAKAALCYLMTLDAPIHSALLGDILELGSHAEQIHRSLGQFAATLGLDKLYAVGEYAPYLIEGAKGGGMEKERLFLIRGDNLKEIALIIKGELYCGECVLIKGSHRTELWKIPNLLDGEDDD